MRKTISFNSSENYISVDESDEQSQVKKEQLAKIARLIILNDLTLRQRQLCKMHYYQGMTVTEIALELGLSKSSVSRTITRGVANLAEKMKYFKLR